MPTDNDDDVELSAMLNQAEPPRSPRHVDDAILNYAKEKARESGSVRGSGWAFMNADWLQRNWMPAAATLSVGVLAISLSIQVSNEPNPTSKSIGSVDIPQKAFMAVLETGESSKK